MAITEASCEAAVTAAVTAASGDSDEISRCSCGAKFVGRYQYLQISDKKTQNDFLCQTPKILCTYKYLLCLCKSQTDQGHPTREPWSKIFWQIEIFCPLVNF